MKTAFFLLFSLFAATVEGIGADFVAPVNNGNATTAGPFSFNSVRYQQVYDSSVFSSLGPIGGGWITAIQFDRIGGAFPADSTANLQISFSTTSRLVDDLITIFSDNLGADHQIVFGPADHDFITGGPPEGVGPLGLAQPYITLETPFFYNPSSGNLLMDIRMYRGLGSTDPENPMAYRASDLPTDVSSRLIALDRDAISGFGNTVGMITGFRITPVPEPSFTVLAVAALAALSLFRLRHKPSTRKD